MRRRRPPRPARTPGCDLRGQQHARRGRFLAHLADAGLSPPEIGVAVLGDLPWPAWEAREVAVQPWPGRLLGETAAEVLLRRIRGDATPPRTLVLRGDTPAGCAPVAL